MVYTPRQQQILASYVTEQQRGLQELIFDKANELYSMIKDSLLEYRVRVVQELAELNLAYWSDAQIRKGRYDVFALSFQTSLEGWQWLQSMHESVIGELEILVARQAVSAVSVK